MSERSDYIKHVSGPLTASLRDQIAKLSARVKELEARTPAPEGEVVAWVRPTELAELADPHHPRLELRLWGHRPWTGYVPLYASPVVPVGVREADLNELRVVCDVNPEACDDYRITEADDLPIGVIRRILAALGTTDQGSRSKVPTEGGQAAVLDAKEPG